MKFKTPGLDYIKISIDRLTRFKPVSEKYNRVFEDILSKFLLSKKPENIFDKIHAVSVILNSKISSISDFSLNEIIKKDEEKVFYLNESDKIFLDNKIDFRGLLELYTLDELPLNLKRLKLQDNTKSEKIREKYSTLYPVSKVFLVEGITEEILLIEFAKILGLYFKKEGIFVMPAGGKNQVAKKYYKLIEEIKIPIFVLLDNDANETVELIKPKLRRKDYLYKIRAGEFEDILSKNLIKEALNFHFAANLKEDEMENENGTVSELSVCFKNNGWGSFKKADFAKIIREYIQKVQNPPVTEELKFITDKIRML